MVGLLTRSLQLRPCSRPLRALAPARPAAHCRPGLLVATRALLRSTQQAPTQLLAWLQDLAVPQPQQTENTAAFSRSIMAQADQITLMKLAAASHFSTSSKAAAPGPSAAQSLPDALLSAALCQQLVAMPPGFTVPPRTTVPAYQFVGIFRTFLGHPVLPQAAKAGSLAAKWGLLSLTLTLAAEGPGAAAFTSALDRLLDEMLLPQAARKLEKVLANPKIPEANKGIAQQRFRQVREECRHNISRWAAAACASPAFATLQPVMAAVAGRLQAAITAGHHQPALPGSQSCSSGKLMEQTVRQVLQDALPAGWSLLPSLHLLGADGAAFAVQQGCKYEVDLLVLDASGVAVAVVEVKLGAANPLMALCNDAGSLLKLVDVTRGKVVTAITQQPAADGDDGAADKRVLAGAGSGAGWGSLLAKARAATAAAPFSEGTGWRAVHVRMHEHVLPIYILGKTISGADTLKGLSSLVDSSALKLLSRSAECVSAALMPGGEPQSESSSCLSSCASVAASSCLPASSSTSTSTSTSSGDDDDPSLGSSATSSSAGVPGSSSTRVVVNLSEQQQQLILEQLQARMLMLHERCLIYSLCAVQQ